MLFTASCPATCCSAAPLSAHHCVFCTVLYLIVTTFFETYSLIRVQAPIYLKVHKTLSDEIEQNLLNIHMIWAECLMEWRFIWIWNEFADWSNVRHNLDERLARDVVKFFAVQSTVTCAQSLCAAVCSVRGSTECCKQQTAVSHNKLYTVQCAHLHNICSN